MGRFNGEGGNKGPDRRHEAKRRRSLGVPEIEGLEPRTLLDGGGLANAPSWTPSNNNLGDAQHGPLAKAGVQLVTVYGEYQRFLSAQNDAANFTSSQASSIKVNGTNVGVDVRGFGDFNTFINTLRDLGMNITATDASRQIVEGLLPISQLPTVARFPQTVAINPIFNPHTNQQGISPNQGDVALFAAQARQQYSVDGTGVTIGVLSDSVSVFQGGLADSVRTGDLLANVNVLQDLPAGQAGTDEGRAMLEQIHDIAPGASLAFHTSFLGEVNFAQGIRDLSRQAGASLIVDDVSYATSPVFQDGIVASAVNDVTTNSNSAYFSSASNFDNGGVETNFRGVDATVGAVGAGRFANFDPNGGVLTQLPITVGAPRTAFFLQFDQPFYTTNGVTSNVEAYVLDGGGNIVAQGGTNTIATQQPFQFLVVPAAGNYTVAIRVLSGGDIGRFRFQKFSDNPVTVTEPFGGAGGTTYPTTGGQSAAANSLAVGAVPWFGTTPISAINPVVNEDFSSYGPVQILFDPAGNRLSSPQIRLKPDLSGTDGNNTSFFGSPSPNPATGQPTNIDSLPNFFGTSSAAPNVAAIAALMRQLSPNSTVADIRFGLLTSAMNHPLNGTSNGQWSVNGGFGLVRATEALSAVDVLRVASTTPANGSTLGNAPTQVVVTFNKPINPNTVQASDLLFTSPPGVTVIVGNPVFSNGNLTATFPITIIRSPGVLANGPFSFTIAAGSIFTPGPNAKPIVADTVNFTLADVTAPTVIATNIVGRRVSVTFSKPMDPASFDRYSVLLVRAGVPSTVSNPSSLYYPFVINADPSMTFSYDPQSNTLTLDFSNIPQVQLPTDNYAIYVTESVTSATGIGLDGEFSGSFPSGDGLPGGAFKQFLGLQTLTAPVISSLTLAPGSDSGINNDGNTNITQPYFVGQISSDFPGTLAGLQVLIEFNGLTNPLGSQTLGVGGGGRGYVVGPAGPQVVTYTDINGTFSFQAPSGLPEGFNRVRAVVLGQPDAPPLPGLATSRDLGFRIDLSTPFVTASSISSFASINSLTNLTLTIADPISPVDPTSPLAVPLQLSFPALDPATVANISNYGLFNASQNFADYSNRIVSANFVPTTNRTNTFDPYTGLINLTFSGTLPAGHYVFVVRTTNPGNPLIGIRDAAGNPLDGDFFTAGVQDYHLDLNIQTEPVYITSVMAVSPSAPGQVGANVSPVRSYFETPGSNGDVRGNTPPTEFVLDFSSPLDPTTVNNDTVQLVQSSDGAGSPYDGDFGNFGTAASHTNPTGFSRVQNTTVRLSSTNPLATNSGDKGYHDRLILTIAPGTTLTPDVYRLYVPNQGVNILRDAFGSQLDGEFLGNPTADTSGLAYQDLLPNGTLRNGYSGDGIAGGSFVTGYTVVAHGNILFARPDYFDDPFITADDPNGSLAKPYTVLAPQAKANALNNGDLNSVLNFGTGFDPSQDRAGIHKFARSAFYAASQLSQFGPVVIVALPGTPQRVPNSTSIVQQTFVLQAPAGGNGTTTPNDGSASVPTDTELVFAAGSTLKLANAALYVQNQGSALIVQGTQTKPVTFTSYFDDSIAGDTNGDGADTSAHPGDWGGLILRNTNDVRARAADPNGVHRGGFPLDNRLGVSGADDVLSSINFATIRYGGGTVPQTSGTLYDAITLYNARPAITNDQISDTAGGSAATTGGSAQAAISADVDSLREDEVGRGVLVRATALRRNGLNGILIRAQANGVAEATDATLSLETVADRMIRTDYVLSAPLPYILVSRLFIGENYLQDSGSSTQVTTNRLYVQPGTLVKSQLGAGIDIRKANPIFDPLNPGQFIDIPGGSLNVGDRTYITQFDANNNVSALDPTFKANTVGDASVLFTSLYDNVATTFFSDPNVIDPITGKPTIRTLVPANDATNSNGLFQPTPGNVPTRGRWGGFTIQSGTQVVIDEAEFRYGGGQSNLPSGTIRSQSVLSFIGSASLIDATYGNFYRFTDQGAHALVTNNSFHDNLDVPISIDANALLATDPLRPLVSGHPFFRGNILTGNGIDGLGVLASVTFTDTGPQEVTPPNGFYSNVDNNIIFDQTDITYVVRGSIILGGYYDFRRRGGVFNFNNQAPVPDTTALAAEQQPAITLTVQSALPDTLLANGLKIARPGESVLLKLLNQGYGVVNAGSLLTPGADPRLSHQVGAGFIVGVDNGIDPPAPDPLVDAGAGSQIRFVGIAANETTGQTRVPVIITSLRDTTQGKTVRGVDMFNIFHESLAPNGYVKSDGSALQGTGPAPGDGGSVFFGGLSLTDYNLYDPRGGNLIDNADLNYLTRVEMQGGGIVDAQIFLPNETVITLGDNWREQKLGTLVPGDQFNSDKAMTVSNSNFSGFSDAAFFAHPGFGALWRPIFPGFNGSPAFAGFPQRVGGLQGFATDFFLVNNTFANMGAGVRVNSEITDGPAPTDTGESPAQAVLLHNTFYNSGIAFEATGVLHNNNNDLSHTYFLLQNNIFALGANNPNAVAIQASGQAFGSQLQYNLFSNYGIETNITAFAYFGTFGSITGDPKFQNAAAGNFFLKEGSPAIDSARSEIGPYALGNMLLPVSTQALDGTGGIRNTTGRVNPGGGSGFTGGFFGGFFGFTPFFVTTQDLINLPGSGSRNFIDEFIPVLGTGQGVGTPTGSQGTAGNGATFNYLPTTSERDEYGFRRQKDSNSSNVGFGSKPFFDLGSHEFRLLFPPHVVTNPLNGFGVTVTTPTGASDLYKVNGVSGLNVPPQTIAIAFDRRIDASSINGRSIQLEESGGDGIFGNGNSTTDRFIDLSGKVSLDPSQKVLIINLSAAGLILNDDLYRIFLRGDGSDVIRDTQGNALDGENIVNGQQQPLPSGDGFPGGTFQVTFSVNSTPSSIVGPNGGSLTLDPAIASPNLSFETKTNPPAFVGQISSPNPTLAPLAGQTVFLQVFDPNTGTYITVGSTQTNATGNFRVLSTLPLPDTKVNVGPDGILGTADDSGYSAARVYVVDQSGNQSRSFAYTGFILDTIAPRVNNVTPATNSLTGLDPSGRIVLSVTINENISRASFNASSVLITRAGGDGVFGNGNDVQVAFDPTSVNVVYQPNTGIETIFFAIPATAVKNDLYQLTLKGTGGSVITDVAGNALDGLFNGVFPSGTGQPGSDFVSTFIVFNPGIAKTFFVSNDGPIDPTAPIGSRNNPYFTITAALNAAGAGDTVAVLPDVYRETVTLKSLVSVISVDPTSTATNLVPGNAQQTIIRPIAGVIGATAVIARNVTSTVGLTTLFSGFTVANPLFGDPAQGTIYPDSVGMQIYNSNLLVTKSYFVDSGVGIQVLTSGANAATPTISDDGIIGNIVGIQFADAPQTASVQGATQFDNNTVGFNTIGALISAVDSDPILVDMVNNIFWQNHDLTSTRGGAAIVSSVQNKALVRYNLFFGNGPSQSSSADDVVNVGNGLDPAALNALPDALGNFVGDPLFVAPRDPRPEADGPATFFQDGNFDLTLYSAAVDNALNSLAPTTDFLGRGRVTIPGRGFPGRGPADLGAFEFNGSAGAPVGGAFRVASTSFVNGGAAHADGASIDYRSVPSQVVVTFSGHVDPNTVLPSSLVLSGTGVDPANAPHATSIFWADDHTAVFTIVGSYRPSGTLLINVNPGGIKSTSGASLAAYSDNLKLTGPAVVTLPPAPVPTPTPAPTPAPTPSPTKPVSHKPTRKAHVPTPRGPVHKKAPVKTVSRHK